MSNRVPCAYSEFFPCDDCKASSGGCARFAELTPEDAERYIPREGQGNLIVPLSCPIPPLTSVIRYGPDYYVLKKGRVLREGFARKLPEYKN